MDAAWWIAIGIALQSRSVGSAPEIGDPESRQFTTDLV
jgi:hypothetical protein